MYGHRARIGYTSPPLTTEVFPYEFYRIVPDGVTLVVTTLAIVGFYKGGSVVPSKGGSESTRIPMMSSQPSPSFGSLSHWCVTKSALTASMIVPATLKLPSRQVKSHG